MNAYIDDLKSLFAMKPEDLNNSSKDGFLQNLLRTGLTKIQGILMGNDGHMYYELSSFGKKFWEVYHENNAA